MSCCCRKVRTSKSAKATAGGVRTTTTAAPTSAAAAAAAAATRTTHPVITRILTCQSGRWYNADSPCPSFEQALREIKAGRKASHWMWYIWPSLIGVRTTKFPDLMIPDLQCAVEYLNHPKLGTRLIDISLVAHAHLRSGLPPSHLFGPMAHVDSEKFLEVMTCFFIAAQTSGNANAGAVFEKCMYAIANVLPQPPPGGMHMPTVQLLQSQLSPSPAPPSPPPPSTSAARHGQDVAGVKHVSQHISSADTTHDAVKGGTGSGADARDIAIAEAASAARAPDISPKTFPQYKGFDCKRVRVELQRLHPRATIEILREGEKQRGVRADRITIVVDAQGDVVAAPRVG